MGPKEKIKEKIISKNETTFFIKEPGNPYVCYWNGKRYSLIEQIGKKLTISEKENLIVELEKNNIVIPNGGLPLGNVSSIVSDLLTIYNLDSNDELKKIRAQMTYDRWKAKYNFYRNGVKILREKRIDPNSFYYVQYDRASEFLYFLLTKGLNLAGTVNSVKKAGKYKISAVEHKEKTVIEITEPYVESLTWKTELFTRLASSVIVGGTVLATAQQEALQKLSDILPGLGHFAYVVSAIFAIGFFSFSKHLIRYIALSSRNKAHLKVLKEVEKADKEETLSGEKKAAIFRLSVMELMADLGYWKELEDVVYEKKEPILFTAVKEQNAKLFSDEILIAKQILLKNIKGYQFIKRRRFRNEICVAEVASNSAKEMNGVGLTSSERGYKIIAETTREEAAHEVH